MKKDRTRRAVEVYDTPSGRGGSDTVENVEQLGGDRVKVRVWYGRATAKGWEAWGQVADVQAADGKRLAQLRADAGESQSDFAARR
jgi:N6-adenosine-specific RNA methylase IME4